ncbi:hypothetical protein GQ627_004725 [Klebsiella pneumoniae]|nr:hypothetical protein GQ627_004725 [Klebsiella pneumoniae]
MSLITLRSPIRCSVNLISHSWLTPVKELTDVGIQYPVYVSAYQPCGQCVPVHRAGFARGLNPYENPHKVVFIDCVQDFHQRILDDLVLQRGDAERALFSIRFWDVVMPAGLRPCSCP